MQHDFSDVDPFFGPIPQSIKLHNTPLTGVLAQVRFCEELKLNDKLVMAQFQDRVRTQYPELTHGQDVVLQVQLDGTRQEVSSNWRFLNSDRLWRLTLTPTFITLETRAYESSNDFVDRLAFVIAALSETIDKLLVTRVGIRYVDRLYGDVLDEIHQYVRPEVLGIYLDGQKEHVTGMVSEFRGHADVCEFSCRTGIMGANVSHEANLMPPIETVSWFLDVDMYREFAEPVDFEIDAIKEEIARMARRSYAVFRWAINDELLQLLGERS